MVETQGRIRLSIVLVCAACFFVGDVAAFEGGSGAEDDPFLVATPEQLDAVREHPGAHFKQVADLDLEGHGEDDAGWRPIGHFRGWLDFEPFTGRYDGNGHVIRNLTINRPEDEHIGLFGYLDEDAAIVNVALIDVDIQGGQHTGALAGYYNAAGRISGCRATGKVSGTRDVGGLVGFNLGAIEKSHAAVDVTATEMSAGGLVGSNNAGTISESHATGQVTGAGVQVGGLVGLNTGGTIKDCHATGDVKGESGAVGGLLGGHSGPLENCHATGAVVGKGDGVGGLIGVVFGTMTNDITGCHATGDVTGVDYVGGLIGRALQPNINIGATTTIEHCYATGDVIGGTAVGGFAGEISGRDSTIRFCHAAGDVTGEDDVGGLAGQLTRGSITSCFATGDVIGETGVGGLVGHGYRGGSIEECYAAGSVTGEASVGGLLGTARGFVDNSYSLGKVSGERNVGGLVGNFYHSGEARRSYYNSDTAEQDDDGTRGVPKTTAELMQRSTFEGWDFEETWSIEEGEDYPRLQWQVRDEE